MKADRQENLKTQYDIRISNEASDGLVEVHTRGTTAYEAYKKRRMEEFLNHAKRKGELYKGSYYKHLEKDLKKLMKNEDLRKDIERVRRDFNIFLAKYI